MFIRRGRLGQAAPYSRPAPSQASAPLDQSLPPILVPWFREHTIEGNRGVRQPLHALRHPSAATIRWPWPCRSDGIQWRQCWKLAGVAHLCHATRAEADAPPLFSLRFSGRFAELMNLW